MKTQQADLTKVSEWVAAGGMRSGLYVLEHVERETDKALGFKAEKYNSYGNLQPSVCWMPKSKVKVVANDFYTNGSSRMYLVPAWLFRAKSDEGYVL